MTKVIFSENTKTYDGSSNEIYKQYCMISSFFGLKEIPKSKIGVTNNELNLIINDYKKLGKSKPCFSSYLRGYIRTKRREHNMKIETIKIRPMENSSDCLEFTDKNLEFISNILHNLKNVKKNIHKKKDKCECVNDEDDDSENDEWNKNCDSYLCTERKCCLNKKSKMLTRSKVSLLRNGSRDYTFMLNIEHEKEIDRLINILEETKEAVEKEINDKWIKDIGVILS
jgi:hypothetical protein